MNYIDIDSSQHELYDSWRKLYTVSFPIFEQRTQEQQEKAFSCADYHLVGYSEGDMFVGFISYWEFSSYRYIEHFALHFLSKIYIPIIPQTEVSVKGENF